jgi:hypothetical protein
MGAVGNRWRIVLYFDRLLASPTDFHNATIQLGERARDLARLGSVEILVVGQEVSTALPENREPDAISQALGWLRLRDTAEHLQVELRRDFLERLAGESSAPEAKPETIAELARVHLADESELLRRFRDQLLLWAVDHATPGPKALMLIGSGYDEEPLEFYRQALIAAGWPRLAESLSSDAPRLTSAELGRSLAVYGWTLLPYTPAQRGDALLEESEEELAARKEEEMTDVVFQDGQIVDKTTIGFDPQELLRRRRQRQQESEEIEVLRDAELPYRWLADSTGGELLRGKFQLSDVLSRLSQRVRFRLEDSPAGAAGSLVPGSPRGIHR